MAIFTRWVGSAISTPTNERGPSLPVGRQRHYGALELAGTGEQVNVNDVVEIADESVNVGAQKPLVQVLSMWEDTFTGVFKFRARFLVHASDLPKDAIARLTKARRAFSDTMETPEGAIGDKEAFPMNECHPSRKQGPKSDNDEVFLTNKMEDLNVRVIVKPVILWVDTSSELPAGLKGDLGPRLTHTYDASSGDFMPVERTDAVVKRARVRHAEVVERASRLAEEEAAAKSGQPAMQSSGWLLPKRRTTAAVTLSSANRRARIAAATPIDSDEGSSDGEPSGEEPPKSDDPEWEDDEQDCDDGSNLGDSSDTEHRQALDMPARKSSRRKKRQVQEYDPGTESSSDDVVQSPSSSPPTVPAVIPHARGPPVVLQDTTVKHQGSTQTRPRRLAMPPVKDDPALLCRRKEDYVSSPFSPVRENSSSVASSVLGPLKTRAGGRRRAPFASILAVACSPAEVIGFAGAPGESMPRPSIAGKRKRGRPAKTAVDGADESNYTPRILVGDEHQADIPDLLSAKDRKKDAATPAAGTSAKMVWRSIRDWDPQSRGMLSAYLHAANNVVQTKQAGPGVAVHVRLCGGAKDQGGGGVDTTGVTSSYAVWAVTAGRTSSGVIRVACSEVAQTEVPMSSIQRVQSEEEALAALVEARCTLDDFQPALKVLDTASPESVDQWTLPQVRTLEQALEKEFDPDRRLHGWAREGVELDREDFIDLANVRKQVPGKTPAQVLSFYYRYLAAADPLTDVVYGKEASEARKLEAILSDGAAGGTAPEEGSSTTRLLSSAKSRSPSPRPHSSVTHYDSIPRRDPPAQSKSNNAAALEPSASMADRAMRTSWKGGLNPDEHMRSRAIDTVFSGRGPEAAVDREPTNGDDSNRGYEAHRSAREEERAPMDHSADVEVLKVTNSHAAARGVGATRGSTFPAVPGSTAAPGRLYKTETHSRQMRPPLVAAGTTAPAPYGHHTEVAVSRPGVHPPQFHAVLHNKAQLRRDHVTGGVMDGGGIAYNSSGSNSGYRGYDERSEAVLDEEDEFGFMCPCWKLLERANAFLDQDQLLYMRGLIATHARKPMTRDQILQRAKSCLQDQPEILAAFIMVFDRINQLRDGSDLVPLYSATKRVPFDTPRDSMLMSEVRFGERVPPTASHTEPGGRASYSSYSQPPPPLHTSTIPPGAADLRGDRHGYGHVPSHGLSYEVDDGDAPMKSMNGSYPFVATAEAHAFRHWPIPADGNRSHTWWRNGASAGAAAYMSATAGLPPAPYSSGPSGRPVMVYSEDDREQGIDPRWRMIRARPQENNHQQPDQWRAGGGDSAYSVAAIMTKAPNSRLSGWRGNGRFGT